MTPNRRLVAVPDTDGELLELLGAMEEILLSLVPHPEDPEEWDPPSPPLGDGSALAAVQRVAAAVAIAERSPAAQLFAPDGRFELVPLRFVNVHRTDTALMAQVAPAFGRALLPAGDHFVRETLREHARRDPIEFVTSASRAHGLLDLTPDRDTVLLAARLAVATGRVVLAPAEYAAYERLTERVLGTFHAGDPVARFLYRDMTGWGYTLDQPKEPHQLNGRMAFFIPAQSGEGGYRPALVVGGRPGVTHIVDGDFNVSWGNTYEEARAAADLANRKRGLSDADVARLIEGALTTSRRPPSPTDFGLGL